MSRKVFTPPPPPHTHTQSQVSGADRQQLTDLESLLLATLQSLLRKVSSTDALSIADTVMTALLMMFQSSLGHSGGVQEDVVLTVGVLVEGELWRVGRGEERRGEGRSNFERLVVIHVVCVCVFVAISGEFAKYMTTFKPFLILALKNFAEHQVQLGGVHSAIRRYFTTPPPPPQVCLAAVGLVGDLCRALTTQIVPYCDEIMQILIENLSVSDLLLHC